MLWPSGLEDCLRAVGRVLDEMGATNVYLEEGDRQLLVRCDCQGAALETRYTTEDLKGLLEEAYARRGRAAPGPPGGYEQRLRAVGQDMDRKKAKNIRLDASKETFTARYFQRGEGNVRVYYLPAMLTGLIERGPRLRR